MPTTTAHVSIYRNTSGERRFFSFLGDNGFTLDDGEDYTHPGCLFTRWQHDTLQTHALKTALENRDIQPIKTTDVFVYDATDGQVFVLGADNSLPVVVDPDVGSYVGDGPS